MHVHCQLEILRKQEMKRQQKAFRARQLSERQEVQVLPSLIALREAMLSGADHKPFQCAHNAQFNEFNSSWDRYLEEYDSMAQMYIQQVSHAPASQRRHGGTVSSDVSFRSLFSLLLPPQMTERHARSMRELQQSLKVEAMEKPPRWSKELLEWRRRQHLLARQRSYAEAQKIKKVFSTCLRMYSYGRAVPDALPAATAA
jgi:hypothetical protein